jgi:hypothetical protein
MIPVDQEFFYDKGEIGDCVRAITASILELDRSEVPHFVKEKPGSDWYDDWEAFMIKHGVKPIMIAGPWESTPPKPLGYYLASGPADRGCKHIVIMWDGKVAHDPHPSRSGLLEIEAIWILK